MRKGYLGVYYPQNATEQLAVPTGAMAILPGEVEVKIKQDTGTIESVGGGGGGSASGKAQLVTAGANALTYALHSGKEVHAEAGVTSVTMALTDFQVSGSNVFGSFWIFNYSGTTLPVTLGAGWSGGISEDGDITNDLVGAGTLVSIPHTMKALIIFDEDRYVRASIIGSEITQAEFNTKLTNNVTATDKILGRLTAGAGLIEEISCTAAGRALLDDADATAQRATLGLGSLSTLSTITSTNITDATIVAGDIADDAVSNAKLADMAANTIKTNSTASAANPTDTALAANQFLARASVGNISALTVTDTAISLLDDSSTTAMRTTLGLGTLATKSTVVSTDMFDGITMRRNELKRRLPKWSSTVLAVDCNGDFTDLSNAPTTLTTNGTVAFAADTNGIGTQVADFAGTSNSVTETTIDLNGHSFSIACWYKKAAVGDSGYLIANTGVGSTNNSLNFGYNGTATKFSMAFWGNDVDYNSAPNDTNWHHAVGTYNTSTNLQSLYIDGALVSTRTSASDLTANRAFYIGRSESSGEWNGLMQQAVIWDNTVLTGSEISSLYNKRIALDQTSASIFDGFTCGVQTAQSITTSADLVIASEVLDTGSYHDNVTNNTRVTVPSTGIYRIGLAVTFSGNFQTVLSVGVNGVSTITLYEGGPSSSTSFTDSGQHILSLNAGDYLTFNMYQNSGSAQNFTLRYVNVQRIA